LSARVCPPGVASSARTRVDVLRLPASCGRLGVPRPPPTDDPLPASADEAAAVPLAPTAYARTMAARPEEADKLLAVTPDRFVAERKALTKKLREEGRRDEADAVAALKKPSAVVLAANRAARDRPKAARAAADAAVAVREAQVAGDADAFGEALGALEDALDLLAQVALAHLATEGRATATDAMRRRLRDLLRNAAADDEAREQLARGALSDELEVTGFSAYAGLDALPKPKAKGKARADEAEGPSRAEQQRARRRERRKELRAELATAEKELRAATAAARAVERDLKRAEKSVASLRKKLDDLSD